MDFGDLADLFHAALILPFLVGSFVLGLWMAERLPETHRGPRTHEMLRIVMEMLVTFAAIVLGLLITNAKAEFDGVEGELRNFSVEIISLDRTLSTYGAQTGPARDALAQFAEASLARGRDEPEAHFGLLSTVEAGVLGLRTEGALQQHLQQVALTQIESLGAERHQIDDESWERASFPFYAMLSVWLMVVYGCFGLISEHTWLGSTVVGLSMLAVCLALFVIFEMESPLTGLITISERPLVDTVATVATR